MLCPRAPHALKTLLTAFMLLAHRPATRAAPQSGWRNLTAGDTVERKIGGAESHAYRVALAAGEFFRARVTERGMEHEYFAKRDTVPCHLSRKWNSDASLVPKQVGSIMGTFALAVMPEPDFHIIRPGADNVYAAHLKDSNGNEKIVKLGTGLGAAYKAFSNKLHVVQEVSDTI